MPADDVRASIDGVWRIESARIIAGLTRLTGDVGLAEDFAQDALVAALERWPESGVPENPGAWLTTAARRRAIDHLRKRERRADKEPEVAHEVGARREGEPARRGRRDRRPGGRRPAPPDLHLLPPRPPDGRRGWP
jgi:predicted RNA polymerase sigma factor